MSLEALVFDVDGTLADTEDAHRRAFNDAFDEQGLGWHWDEPEYARLLKTTGGKERIGAYIRSLDLDPESKRALSARIPAVHECKTGHYVRLIEQGRVPLREGIAQLLTEAQAAGLKLAIASTTTRDNIDALLFANLGRNAIRQFSVIGAGDEVGRKKPAPDIYQYVLRKLGLGAEVCAAVEDSAHGLAAAKAAGLFTVVTPNQWTCEEDFSAADWVQGSLGDFEQPLKELGHRFNESRTWGWQRRSTAVGDA